MLRIGRIAYANCTPVFEALHRHFPCSNYEFVVGVPAALNVMLRQGELHVCPSSSIEYAMHPDCYRILPHLSISSNGAVKSVLLFSKKPVETLHDSTISVSAESATSVNLLKILMKQRFGCNCSYLVNPAQQIRPHIGSDAILLIGDTALKTCQTKNNGYIYDLGKLWHDWTGLPFVFALWICTVPALASHWHELCCLNERLQHAKAYATSELEQIAEISADAEWMGKDHLIDYWRNNISYDLTNAHLQGLQLFYEKSFQLGLIPQIPELQFL